MPNLETITAEAKKSPEALEQVSEWLKIIENKSLFPMANKPLAEESLRLAVVHNVSPKFILTLCPAFRNLGDAQETSKGGPTREMIPFIKEFLPRLPLFAKEIAALVVGTKQVLGLSPQILLIINDIFEPGVEKRLANITGGKKILEEAKIVFHRLFQEVDEANPEIWPFRFQSSIRIVLQSDFVKPLQRFGLPEHNVLVTTLIRETLDPQTDAFRRWLQFLRNTRADSLMSPNAWLTTSSALALHERVRFLVAMYWIDGLIIPLLFRTIFRPEPNKRVAESLVSPIFVCGVTRELQAEMEMAGVNFHLDNSSINSLPAIQERKLLVPRAALHVIRNTASWPEPPLEPFSFGGRVILK